jgi:hypothetical protein
MSTYTHPLPASIPHVRRDLAWFGFVAAVAFAVPYVGISVLDLQHDLYYLAYFAVTLGLLGAWARVERIDVAAFVRRRWPASLGLGVAVAALVVANVLRQDATARPDGAYYVFELLWRGVGYGAIDALLLTAFPCAVAYQLLRGKIDGLGGRVRFAAVALPLILLITATYHLGYPQYREDTVRQPEVGNTLISIPALATANPVGAVIAHVSMHVAAVTHAYETPIFLPPETKA